jgi:hypothetical protein
MKTIIVSFLAVIVLATPTFAQSEQAQSKEMTDGELIGTTLLALNKTTKRHDREIGLLIVSESNTVEKIDNIHRAIKALTDIAHKHDDSLAESNKLGLEGAKAGVAAENRVDAVITQMNLNTAAIQRTMGDIEERLSKLEAKQK